MNTTKKPQLPRFEVKFLTGAVVVVRAANEAAARRAAMVEKYGKRPDSIVPHAPEYDGRGLTARRVA